MRRVHVDTSESGTTAVPGGGANMPSTGGQRTGSASEKDSGFAPQRTHAPEIPGGQGSSPASQGDTTPKTLGSEAESTWRPSPAETPANAGHDTLKGTVNRTSTDSEIQEADQMKAGGACRSYSKFARQLATCS